MNNLDDPNLLNKLDKSSALASIKLLANQCSQAWQQSTKVITPLDYRQVRNIVISGMGGSSYGARIVKSLYGANEQMKIPVEMANNYFLPGFVGPETLVILSSYSGTTEETLAAAKQAKIKGAKIMGLTCGGELADFLKSNNYPSYIINPEFNPSRQPRIGVGYMVFGLLGLLANIKIISVGNADIQNIVNLLEKNNDLFSDSVPTAGNPVKKLAVKMYNKIPVFIVADFLEGAAYALRNPFHETSKQFALFFTIPELNHHLLEGLAFPSTLPQNFIFILIRTNNYDKRNSLRLKLTGEIFQKNNFQKEEIILRGFSPLSDTMELIQMGSWITFYLAMLNGVDPSKIPWVDYFKKELLESSKGS